MKMGGKAGCDMLLLMQRRCRPGMAVDAEGTFTPNAQEQNYTGAPHTHDRTDEPQEQ